MHLKPILVVANDETGKIVCVYAGPQGTAEQALEIWRDESAARKAGLKGDISVAIYRSPPHWRRRTYPAAAQSEKPKTKKD